MKNIINQLSFLCALALLAIQSNAQIPAISPDVNQEYCPNTNINFVVSVPGTISNITSYSGGCFVISRNANTFVGRFNDVNAKQVFLVEYTDAGGLYKTYYPEFKKVKSLFYSGSTCGYIQPNQTTIIAPSCQVNIIPISFNKIQWYTEFEYPTSCFPHFLKTSSERLEFTEYVLSNGCPVCIFGYVFA